MKNSYINFLYRLCGSYEDLQIGQVSEALVDFTGGVNITIKLAEAPPDLWDILTRATYSRSLIGCQTHLGVRVTIIINNHICMPDLSSKGLGTVYLELIPFYPHISL